MQRDSRILYVYSFFFNISPFQAGGVSESQATILMALIGGSNQTSRGPHTNISNQNSGSYLYFVLPDVCTIGYRRSQDNACGVNEDIPYESPITQSLYQRKYKACTPEHANYRPKWLHFGHIRKSLGDGTGTRTCMRHPVCGLQCPYLGIFSMESTRP